MYPGIREIFGRYWTAYGGWKAVMTSGYFHLAVLLLLITTPYWLHQPWWEQPLSIIPNLLGFSLGGLAMFLSFGNEAFQKIIARRDDDEPISAYASLASSFVHFMILQVAALTLSLARNALDFTFNWPTAVQPWVTSATFFFSGLAYLVFLYSITSMLAAVFAIFRVTGWFEVFQNRP